MLRVSTGFTTKVLAGAPFAQLFHRGCIRVFAGTQPASADAPEQGTLLGVVSEDGLPWTPGQPDHGLRWLQSGKYMLRDPAQHWRLRASAQGTAGWFRLVGNSVDAGGYSFTAPRLDGAVGIAPGEGVQLVLTNPFLVINAARDLDAAWYSFNPT